MDLRTYVRGQQNKGYTIEQIREHCLEQGYTPPQVDEALGLTSSLPFPRLLIESLFLIVLLSLVAFVFLQSPIPEPFTGGIGEGTLRQVPVELAPIAEVKFGDAVARCTQTTLEVKVLESMIMRYEVLGPEDEYCKVRARFIENPDPDVQGKGMVCLFDRRRLFSEVVADLSRCSGPLADILA